MKTIYVSRFDGGVGAFRVCGKTLDGYCGIVSVGRHMDSSSPIGSYSACDLCAVISIQCFD